MHGANMKNVGGFCYVIVKFCIELLCSCWNKRCGIVRL